MRGEFWVSKQYSIMGFLIVVAFVFNQCVLFFGAESSAIEARLNSNIIQPHGCNIGNFRAHESFGG